MEVYSILMSSDVTDANYQETGIQLELPLPIDVSVYRQLVGDRQSLTLQSAAAADPEYKEVTTLWLSIRRRACSLLVFGSLYQY